jgi:hypothetical protein
VLGVRRITLEREQILVKGVQLLVELVQKSREQARR